MLQRLCENMQYAPLLNKAAKSCDSILRTALVAAFVLGGYAVNSSRTLKFFNPILGETYEYIDNFNQYKFFAEQVSHHPPIASSYTEGIDWVYYGSHSFESNFRFFKNCLEWLQLYKSYFQFTSSNELISVSKPVVAVKNVMFGKIHLDVYGTLEATNHNTGYKCEFELLAENYPKSGDIGVITGKVYDINGIPRATIKGNMYGQLELTYLDKSKNPELIFSKLVEGDEHDYYFSEFDINLNNDDPELLKTLPITDSRFRPDQRALENQSIEFAKSEKLRLEERQRKEKAGREKQDVEYNAKYFKETIVSETGERHFDYNSRYWEDKSKQNFGHMPDIFGGL